MPDSHEVYKSQEILALSLGDFALEQQLESAHQLIEQFVTLASQDGVLLNIENDLDCWEIGGGPVGGATIKIDEMTGRILMRPWNHCNFYHFTEVDLHFNISSGKLEGRQPDLTLNTLADAPVRRRPAIAVLAETFVEMAELSKTTNN